MAKDPTLAIVDEARPILLAVVGLLSPTTIPLCFAPEEAGQAIVVCPTGQSMPFSTDRTTGATATRNKLGASGVHLRDLGGVPKSEYC